MSDSNKSMTSAIVLANAATIAAGVMRGIASQSVASSMNGRSLVSENVAQMVCMRVTKKLQERLDKARQMRIDGYTS